MDNLVTIASFTFPTELAVIKGRLESEEIECFVKDELTVQIHNFYSNAIGGIKLQVKESDVDKAVEILKDAGYLKDTDSQPSGFLVNLERLTSRIPFIKKFSFELRILLLSAIFLTIIILSIYFITLPNTYEYLTKQSWCVSHLSYNGQDYQPYSIGIFINGLEFCRDNISFRTNGVIVFPGFSTLPISGTWTIDNDVLKVNEVDTFAHILKGNYEVEVEGSFMTLTSDKTVIYCFRSP